MKGTSHPMGSTIPFSHKFSVTVQLDGSGDQTGSLTSGDKVASSLTHDSTGKYTLNLADKWPGGCRELNVSIIKDTPPDAIPFVRGTPSTDTYASTPVIKFGFMDTTGSLKDPVSCYLQISGVLKQQTGV
jgi:hypothetical protein